MAYHKKYFLSEWCSSGAITKNNLLSEGRRVLHSAKMPPMGSTKRTSHWWHFLLGDAIDPLSQEINLLSEWCSSGADMKKLRMGCT